MFCPKCKSEYRHGFIECSDCKISLVEQLPIEKTKTPVEFKEIRSSLRQDDVSIIKSILDANGINYVVHSESSGTMYPIPSLNRLMIDINEYDVAVELLKGFL